MTVRVTVRVSRAGTTILHHAHHGHRFKSADNPDPNPAAENIRAVFNVEPMPGLACSDDAGVL
jgi:hypothetical protein